MLDADKRDLAIKRFNKSILTWDRFAEEAKGHEKDAIVIKLPEPIKREYAKPGTNEVFSIEFPAMSLVKLPNGQELSILTRFDENNRPVFGISEEILRMFVEKELSEEAHK